MRNLLDESIDIEKKNEYFCDEHTIQFLFALRSGMN